MQTVLISGASIAGPALAYWLSKLGFKPTVVERAPALRPGGQAIDIRGVALTVADRMGILGDASKARTHMRGMSVVDVDGNEVFRTTEASVSGGRLDSNDIELLRDDLIQILYDRTKSTTEYIFNDSATSIADGGSTVNVTFESGMTRSFDLVVGADGLRSNTRKQVFGADSGFMHKLGTNIALFSTPNILNLDNWQLSCRHEDAGFLIYPARNNAELRVALGFGQSEADDVRMSTQQQKELVAQRCSGLRWKIPELLEAMWSAPDFYLGPMAQIRMDRWSKGRVVLLGDAAFSPSPLSGQGTSLALVGAYILATELGASPSDHSAALERYEKRMRPFVRLNQALATENPEGTGPSEASLDNAKNAILLD